MSKRKIIKRVSKVLLAEYGSAPILYFCDTDGDHVLIKRYSDIRFALKSHSQQQQQQQLSASQHETDASTVTSITSTVTSSHPTHLLRLHACIEGNELPAVSTLGLSRTHTGSLPLPLPDLKAATMEGDVLLCDDKFHWQKGN